MRQGRALRGKKKNGQSIYPVLIFGGVHSKNESLGSPRELNRATNNRKSNRRKGGSAERRNLFSEI